MCILTRAQKPDPEQVPKVVMNQACSTVASISTCTCLYSRITVEIMLKSLWVGFHLCFLFSGFVFLQKNLKKDVTRVLNRTDLCSCVEL